MYGRVDRSATIMASACGLCGSRPTRSEWIEAPEILIASCAVPTSRSERGEWIKVSVSFNNLIASWSHSAWSEWIEAGVTPTKTMVPKVSPHAGRVDRSRVIGDAGKSKPAKSRPTRSEWIEGPVKHFCPLPDWVLPHPGRVDRSRIDTLLGCMSRSTRGEWSITSEKHSERN